MENIISLDGKFYKKCNVVMLPTEKVTRLIKVNNQLKLTDKSVNSHNQHLYILSDEEIKEGDWVMVFTNGRTEVHQTVEKDAIGWIMVGDFKFDQMAIFKKIIATTDPELNRVWEERQDDKFAGFIHNIPKPSNTSLKVYCEQGDIDEVLVECYGWKDCPKGYSTMQESSWGEKFVGKLKVAPDNTITIKPTKDSWNREEVKDLLLSSFGELAGGLGYNEDLLGKWIEENL